MWFIDLQICHTKTGLRLWQTLDGQSSECFVKVW